MYLINYCLLSSFEQLQAPLTLATARSIAWRVHTSSEVSITKTTTTLGLISVLM